MNPKNYIDKQKVIDAIDEVFLEDKYLPEKYRKINVYVKKKYQLLKKLGLSPKKRMI